MTTDSERINLGAIRDRLTVIGMAESFFQSSVLFALAKLRIFELIGEEDKPLDELARQSGAKPETLARLLNAGVVLEPAGNHGRRHLPGCSPGEKRAAARGRRGLPGRLDP